MKVLDLQCRYQHSFEGWFASEDDFQSQLGRSLIECPLCTDKTITKMLSAPRLNFGASQPSVSPSLPASSAVQTSPSKGVDRDVNTGLNSEVMVAKAAASVLESALQAAWLQMVRRVVANTEDVGNKFVEEVRKIHYGESQERAIRGYASRKETVELLEEGISVMPLPIPTGLTGTLQ